jgi:hypothetical protein
LQNPSFARLRGQAARLADTRWQTSTTEESSVGIVSFSQTFRKGAFDISGGGVIAIILHLLLLFCKIYGIMSA